MPAPSHVGPSTSSRHRASLPRTWSASSPGNSCNPHLLHHGPPTSRRCFLISLPFSSLRFPFPGFAFPTVSRSLLSLLRHGQHHAAARSSPPTFAVLATSPPFHILHSILSLTGPLPLVSRATTQNEGQCRTDGRFGCTRACQHPSRRGQRWLVRVEQLSPGHCQGQWYV